MINNNSLNNKIVNNAWFMLKYLYEELGSRKFKSLDISDVQDINNLYGLVLGRWCAALAREGLYKEYVTIEGEEMTSPQGQLDIQETINRQTKVRGSLVCNYDELSGDILLNHILKGTMEYLCNSNALVDDTKKEIKKCMQSFNGIGTVDISKVRWNDIKYNNSTIRYKHLLDLSRSVMAEKEIQRSMELTDSMRLYILFKKQIYKWYLNNYGEEDDVFVIEQPYTLSSETALDLKTSRNHQLVTIMCDNIALLIMVRLQDEKTARDTVIQREQKQELAKFVSEFKAQYKIKAHGCIIYVNTNPANLNLQPIVINSFRDITIGELTVDINDQWLYIENKLKSVYEYFIERVKVKAKGMGQTSKDKKQ